MGLNTHTPGPWSLWRGAQYVGGGEDICIGAGETWLANMDHRMSKCGEVYALDGHPGDWDGDNCPICSIDADGISAEQLANAHLIAAAPDLLAALQALVDAVRGHPEDTFNETYAADAAIAKARGETP